jgi:hypothetical protein
VPNNAHLITGGRPVYLYDIFQNRSAFPGSTFPFTRPDGSGRVYRQGDCPVAEDAFRDWITMHVYEHYSPLDIQEIAHGIGKVAHFFGSRGR